MEFRYQSGESLRLERRGDQFTATIGENTYEVELQKAQDGELFFVLTNASGEKTRHHVYTALGTGVDKDRRYVAFNADVITLVKADTTKRRKAGHGGDHSLAASMPGQVVKVLVSEGDEVTRGQALVVLEAMKMEIRVTAPNDGKITKLLVSAGQVVERGQALLELE